MNKTKINVKATITILLIVVILGTTVAYSSLTSSLTISGELVVNPPSSDGISINHLTCTSTSTPPGTIEYSSVDGLAIISGITLPELTSSVSCSGTIINNNDYMVKLSSTANDIYDNEYIEYDFSGTYLKDIINANSSREFTIVFSYPSTTTTLPDNTSLQSDIILNFRQIYSRNIIQDGLTFYIAGEDEINSQGKWPERINGSNVELKGDISRNALYHSYYFTGSNTCGYTDKTLIPVGDSSIAGSGDFTIETRVSPDDFATNRAIISQKRYREISTTNEDGRFKPFDIYGGGIRYFWRYGPLSTQLTEDKYFGQSFITGQSMYLTLVRQGDTFYRYLEGVLIGSATYSGTVMSPYTTQIGCFSTYNTSVGISYSQNYAGHINMVRIYNRALTANEIYQNYESDNEYYSSVSQETDLKSIAIGQPVSTNGTGLYSDTNYPSNNGVSRYVYRGSNPNNYIVIGKNHYDDENVITESEQIWRIMSFETDGTMKLVKPTLYPTAFDLSGNRNIANSPYCINSEEIAETVNGVDIYKGCNSFSSQVTYGTTTFSTPTMYTGTTTIPAVSNNSTMLVKLNNLGAGTIYTSDEIDVINASNISTWNVGAAKSTTSTFAQTLDQINNYTWRGKVGTISVYDIKISNTVEVLAFAKKIDSSYIANLATETKNIWTLNAYDSQTNRNTWDVPAILAGPKIDNRRASRETYETITFYTVPVIRIDSNIQVSGNGTEAIPYRLIEE